MKPKKNLKRLSFALIAGAAFFSLQLPAKDAIGSIKRNPEQLNSSILSSQENVSYKIGSCLESALYGRTRIPRYENFFSRSINANISGMVQETRRGAVFYGMDSSLDFRVTYDIEHYPTSYFDWVNHDRFSFVEGNLYYEKDSDSFKCHIPLDLHEKIDTLDFMIKRIISEGKGDRNNYSGSAGNEEPNAYPPTESSAPYPLDKTGAMAGYKEKVFDVEELEERKLSLESLRERVFGYIGENTYYELKGRCNFLYTYFMIIGKKLLKERAGDPGN